MKAKTLLLSAAIVAVSLMNIKAQRLLVSEEFSSPEWQAEFLRLNPGADELGILINLNAPNILPWATRSPGDGEYAAYLYGSMNTTDLYFDKYKLAGNTEIINGTWPEVKTCAEGGNHNVVINEGEKTGEEISMGFRLFKSDGYFEFPEVPNAGRITAHVLCGNSNNKSELAIEQFIDGTWTSIKSLTIKNRKALTESIDEVLFYYVNSRTPVALRIASVGKPFVALFETSIEEHPSVELKQSIDSATIIRAANTGNIGTSAGQYPPVAYDSLGIVIDSMTTVFNDLAQGRGALLTATTNMNNAIADFNASKLQTNLHTPQGISFKQIGRKLVINTPTNITIYNTVGTIVSQSNQVKVIEIPTSVGNGIFIVKTTLGVHKVYLSE